jgi:hypothetical protein
MITKTDGWKVICKFKTKIEAQELYDYINEKYQPSKLFDNFKLEYSPFIKVKFAELVDDGSVCPRCGQGMYLHDFGVPYPLCP